MLFKLKLNHKYFSGTLFSKPTGICFSNFDMIAFFDQVLQQTPSIAGSKNSRIVLFVEDG